MEKKQQQMKEDCCKKIIQAIEATKSEIKKWEARKNDCSRMAPTIMEIIEAEKRSLARSEKILQHLLHLNNTETPQSEQKDLQIKVC